MSWLLGLAWHNLWRQRQRNLIAAIALGIGVAIYLLIDSSLASAADESVQNMQRHTSGTAQLMTADYWRNRQYHPLDQALTEASALQRVAEKAGWETTPAIDYQAELLFRHQGGGTLFAGLLPVELHALPVDQTLLPLKSEVARGRWPRAGAAELILGAGMAKDLGLKLDDFVVVRSRNSFGEVTSDRLHIVGIIHSADSALNRVGAYLSLDYARTLLEMPDSATSIILRLPGSEGLTPKAVDKKMAPLVAALAAQIPPELQILSWREIGSLMLQTINADRGSSAFVLILAFLLGGLGCWNASMLSVYQRQRELAMLRALGMKGSHIGFLVLLESALVGLIGGLLGGLLALPFNALLIHYGLDYSQMMTQQEIGYRISGILRGEWRWHVWIVAIALAPLLTFSAALLPAWSGSRKPLAAALQQRGAC